MVEIKDVLDTLEWLIKLYTVYATYIVALTLAPFIYAAPYVSKGYMHLYKHYPYILYGTIVLMFYGAYCSRKIEAIRPTLQYYAKRIFRWWLMLLTLPLWVWWLVPLRMYQKRKAQKEAAANGFYRSNDD